MRLDDARLARGDRLQARGAAPLPATAEVRSAPRIVDSTIAQRP